MSDSVTDSGTGRRADYEFNDIFSPIPNKTIATFLNLLFLKYTVL